MQFVPTLIPGCYLIEIKTIEDERGFFARRWCREEMVAAGLNPALEQCNISYNRRRGTLRGLHYQSLPHEETKLVRCTRGALFDVAVDLRPDSPAFCRWVSVELTGLNHKMLYVPEGCAHGFQTLEDDTEVFYQVSELYHPESAGGVLWNDPAFAITWPLPVSSISERDLSHSPLDPAQFKQFARARAAHAHDQDDPGRSSLSGGGR